MEKLLALSLLLAACGGARHEHIDGAAGSRQVGRPSSQSGGADSGGSSAGPSAGMASADAAANLLCPSLERATDSLLLVASKGSERALIRADGAVHLRHTLPFDAATGAYFGSEAELFFGAVQSGLRVDVTERRWQIVHFDAEGGLLEAAQGVLPAASSPLARSSAPSFRRQNTSIALEQADGDTWLVDFDGSARLRECERHTPLGPTEESGVIGAWVELQYGAREAAFVDVEGGTCRRLTSSRPALFAQGRFQSLHTDSGTLLLRDAGPSTTSELPLWPEDSRAQATLHAVSDDVLYVLSAPRLARYDVVARQLQVVTLPSAATSFGLHGERLVGHEQGVPRWSYQLKDQTTIVYDLGAPAGATSTRSSQDFLLIASDERPTTWLSIATGETRPFEVVIPTGATLETIEQGARSLLIADGLPIAHVDLAAGRATPLALPRAGSEASTFRSGGMAFVVLDGVPAFRVDLESGQIEEVEGALGFAGLARSERLGAHVVVSSAGRPQALLDEETLSLVPLEGADQAPFAATLIASAHYVVGFDQRSWPVFRIDVAKRKLVSYAVTGPSELSGFRDARYLETAGDALYERYSASSLADAQVLEDGSVAVALRDARQGRLWLVSPEDTAFRPLGRPVSGVIGLSWSTKEHSIRIAGERGDCYCQPPVFRWEATADADVVASGSVQLVARAHPSLVIVRSDQLVEEDASGVCVVESAAVPLVHDLLAGTSVELAGVDGELRFLQISQ